MSRITIELKKSELGFPSKESKRARERENRSEIFYVIIKRLWRIARFTRRRPDRVSQFRHPKSADVHDITSPTCADHVTIQLQEDNLEFLIRKTHTHTHTI